VFVSLVVELAFDVRAVFLLFHSVLRFMHLKLFLVMVLISCAPVVGVLSFFPPGAPAMFFRGEYAG
jgi:hypothetical protein